MAEEEPKMNIWVCIISLVLSVGLLAVTAEFVKSSTSYSAYINMILS